MRRRIGLANRSNAVVLSASVKYSKTSAFLKQGARDTALASTKRILEFVKPQWFAVCAHVSSEFIGGAKGMPA
jgi:hypothetical protein